MDYVREFRNKVYYTGWYSGHIEEMAEHGEDVTEYRRLHAEAMKARHTADKALTAYIGRLEALVREAMPLVDKETFATADRSERKTWYDWGTSARAELAGTTEGKVPDVADAPGVNEIHVMLLRGASDIIKRHVNLYPELGGPDTAEWIARNRKELAELIGTETPDGQ
jgi:hypothetical protein